MTYRLRRDGLLSQRKLTRVTWLAANLGRSLDDAVTSFDLASHHLPPDPSYWREDALKRKVQLLTA